MSGMLKLEAKVRARWCIAMCMGMPVVPKRRKAANMNFASTFGLTL
jgi:hypothetical protein